MEALLGVAEEREKGREGLFYREEKAPPIGGAFSCCFDKLPMGFLWAKKQGNGRYGKKTKGEKRQEGDTAFAK